MPKVSIIVPVYNTEKYLRRCLNGLVNQTLQDIEIIVVDDGSTDGSAEIIEEFAKSSCCIRVIHKENGGQGSARNLGIIHATGDYIGFADSDDYVDTTLFEKMYQKAVETDADMVECRFYFLEETKKGNKQLPARGNIREYKNKKEMFIDPQVSPWNKLYRRSIIQGKVAFPEKLIYEDTSFYIKAIPYIQKTACVEESLVYYFLRQNSTVNANKNRKVGDIISVLKDAMLFYQQYGFFEEYHTELEYFISKILLCSSTARIGRIPDRKLRKQLLNQSFEFLNDNFPEYRKNPYLHGKTGFYIKHSSGMISYVFAGVFGKVIKG